MAYNFVPCDRDQPYLLPPSLKDWLPEGDLAWFVLAAVDQMDLKVFYEGCRGDGWGGKSFSGLVQNGVTLQGVEKRGSRRG